MTYTTLLVHLELGHPYAGLLRCARETATRFAAHVIGIAASQPFSMVLGDGYVCGNAIESSVEEIAAEERQAEADFRAALATGARSLEWRSTAAGIAIAEFVARNARGADLILTGAYGHSRFREWVIGGMTRELLLPTKQCAFLSH